jgi:hypothetical protein
MWIDKHAAKVVSPSTALAVVTKMKNVYLHNLVQYKVKKLVKDKSTE